LLPSPSSLCTTLSLILPLSLFATSPRLFLGKAPAVKNARLFRSRRPKNDRRVPRLLSVGEDKAANSPIYGALDCRLALFALRRRRRKNSPTVIIRATNTTGI